MFLVPDGVATETKLSATETFNLIAADVLFYRLFASGAFPGIFFDPDLIIFFLIGDFFPIFYF